MLQTLTDTFTPVFWGGLLALVLNLPLSVVEAQLAHGTAHVRRVASLALVLLGLIAMLFLGLWLLIPQLASAVTRIGEILPTVHQGVQRFVADWLKRVIGNKAMFSGSVFSTAQIEDASKNAMSGLMNMGVAAVTYTAQQAMRFAIALVLAIYLLLSKENLSHKASLVAKAVLGNVHGTKCIAISRHASSVFASFMLGQLLEALILAGLFVLVLFVAKMPYVLPIATLIGVTSFVPVFGSIAGGMLGFLLVVSSNPEKGFWFLLFFVIVQQFENNFIYPRVVGGRVGLPPLWVMLAVIIGGGLFGLPGLFIGVPATSVLYQLGGEWVHARTDNTDGG